MTKAQAKAEFDELYPRESFKMHNGCLDTIMRREAWNNYTDALCKDRRITSHQYETWTHPWKD